MRSGATLLIRLQTEMGVISAPGADEGEERANTLSISVATRGVACM